MAAPIPPLYTSQKERLAHVFLEYGHLDVMDGALVLIDAAGVRIQIPAGSLSTIFLEPGTRVSHAAVALAAKSETMLVWVGEAGNRLYSAGGNANNLLTQAGLYCDETKRIAIVRRMYEKRFGEPCPTRRSIEQLRGIEGARIRELYKSYATRYRVRWTGRDYDPKNWSSSNDINRTISAGNACLHGLCDAVICAMGYSPAIGFIHSGNVQSFVFDIADLYKFDYSVPMAFQLLSQNVANPETVIRHRLRNLFRSRRLVATIADDLATLMQPPQAGT